MDDLDSLLDSQLQLVEHRLAAIQGRLLIESPTKHDSERKTFLNMIRNLLDSETAVYEIHKNLLSDYLVLFSDVKRILIDKRELILPNLRDTNSFVTGGTLISNLYTVYLRELIDEQRREGKKVNSPAKEKLKDFRSQDFDKQSTRSSRS